MGDKKPGASKPAASSKRKCASNSSVKKNKLAAAGQKRDASSNGFHLEDETLKETDCNSPHEIISEVTGGQKRPRRAAACTNFKEKSFRVSDASSVIEVRKYQTVEDEKDAIELTRLGAEGPQPCRKIVDFILHDDEGNPHPFEMSEISDLYITALVAPFADGLETEKQTRVKCQGFGRIENWAISGYDEGTPVIWISTEIADYECVKPSASYKRFYGLFLEKARTCVEVYKKLARSAGGNPELGLEELLASVTRSMCGNKSFSDCLASREFVISLGEFIYKQLIGLDETSEKNDAPFSTLPALIALKDLSEDRTESIVMPSNKPSGSLRINGKTKSVVKDDDDEDDEKLARLLQEEENWKSMKQLKSRKFSVPQSNIYIKISESEIANDYPLPAYYKPSVEEMDEFIFFDDGAGMYSSDLPRRMLSNWCLYNSDSRLISLELLPMKPCAEMDLAIFGSGNMREDDGSGYCHETELVQSSSSSSSALLDEGVPVYLSAIKEWMIEFGSSMIFISIRTDVAWYRLGKPAKQYLPWYEPVLRTARLAISIITLLKEQTRVSKLSFAEVIKKVTEFKKDNSAFISSNIPQVERYVVVHGQIILQQFAEYPDVNIQKCAFVTGLSEKMLERHHTKLVTKKKLLLQKEANLNPSAVMKPVMSRRNVMRATTTRLINKIWGEYYSNNFPEDMKGEQEMKEEQKEDTEEDAEENEEEDAEEESVLIGGKTSTPPSNRVKRCVSKIKKDETKWVGESTGEMAGREKLFGSAMVRGNMVVVGGAVTIESDKPDDEPSVVYIEYMFEKNDGSMMVHGRLMQRGFETVLGNAAKEREVFLTHCCIDFELQDVKETVMVDIRRRLWGHAYRAQNSNADKMEDARADERKKKELPVEYYCKSLYWPERGAFFALPFVSMGRGNGVCGSCKQREAQDEEEKFQVTSPKSFVHKKLTYDIHDFVYVKHNFFGLEEDGRLNFKAGRNVGLKAYVVCQILEIETPKGNKELTAESTHLKVRRFYRPEDVSATKAYVSDIRELYYSEEILSVSVEAIEGKCEVRKKIDVPTINLPVISNHVFFCEYLYDPANGSIKQLPSNVKLVSPNLNKLDRSMRKNKGKEKCMANIDDLEHTKPQFDKNQLATLDIFAGCGGLSEGLQHSGASYTKWAIEYDEPAGEAFKKNHPDTQMFIDNCNVILRAIMEKGGDLEDCVSTSEADERAAKLDEEKIKNLPLPGQVDFINGGPPCQGFSGMNRYNQSPWSKVQCEMILAFLSFAEYFRPRYFLLENVRNFVSFNKGQTFRLTLATLLEMGYQVRFGILEAGAYGVAQSRKRAFIWAASPEETLPEWPEPMHVFAGSELKIALPGAVHYAANRSTAGGAPFRPLTVRDTIGDLPPIGNGASKPSIDYEGDPVSWFQKQIRGKSSVLNDHISKEMNELNLIRCQRIPKRPGCDWHDLPDEKVKLSTGQMVDLIPWCLPNTAKRHNQWKGLFGRLDWEGNFPTSITDPQPMGKVGMCFHPDQDRIVSVRECARSQGFPDSYHFFGNIQSKHRQIGNAVPPPLSYALGRKLKEAIDAKLDKV